jgi:glycosyltransferase involved in cell wall biosynthesis
LKALYISYDGMTDPLGQSQVIPYLQGLAAKGIKFWLISFEKPDRLSESGGSIKKLLDQSGIVWIPIRYTSKPPIFSTLYDLFKMRRNAYRIIRHEKIDIVHCRSYISAICGLWAKRKYKTRFIFDMRGFWADERVDGGIWNLSNPVYRTIYNYFKRLEKIFLREADAIVSLTDHAKTEIKTWPGFSSLQIDVIPCCADLSLFSAAAVDPHEKEKASAEAGIPEKSFVLSYLGSVGTWYMLPEMLKLYGILLEKKPSAVFLIITPDSPEMIRNEAAKLLPGLDTKRLIIKKAARSEVPLWASLSDISVFFIRPLYSKKASSPTKMGELMGLGIPIICNSGIGDVDSILKKAGNGILIHSFEASSMRKALEEIDAVLALDPAASVSCAHEVYSLEEGVKRYEKIYRRFYS